MAKIAFSKLNKIKNVPPVTHQFGEHSIEIEQYLPLEDKVNLITAVIEQSGNGEEGFFNIVKLEAYYRIEVIKAYTNISFTEKQLEDTTKLYDAIILNDIWAFIEDKIPGAELDYIWNSILALAKEITEYNHSALGIIKNLTETDAISETDVQKLMEELSAAAEAPQIKNLLSALGAHV